MFGGLPTKLSSTNGELCGELTDSETIIRCCLRVRSFYDESSYIIVPRFELRDIFDLFDLAVISRFLSLGYMYLESSVFRDMDPSDKGSKCLDKLFSDSRHEVEDGLFKLLDKLLKIILVRNAFRILGSLGPFGLGNGNLRISIDLGLLNVKG